MRRLAVLILLAAPILLVGVGCTEAPSDLVLISLDTTRRDHLPTYGYARDTAPALDALARRSAVCWNAFAQDTNTNPSHASMFTGLYPHVHGSLANGVRMPDGRTTLAQILREAGFRTGGFVSAVTLHSRITGLDRGFDEYDDRFQGRRRSGAQTTSAALRWLGAAQGRRTFLFLHLYDAHGPYRPPPGYAGRFVSDTDGPKLRRIPAYQRQWDAAGRPVERLHAYVDAYDDAIRFADDQVQRVLERIDLERAVVVVLADHGETLDERYQQLDHGGQVFDEQIRIPLVVHVPGAAPRRIDDSVETTDLLPTLLELLDVKLPEGVPLQGRSLAPVLRGATGPGERPVFSSARAVSERHADRGYRLDPARRIHAIRDGRWKLIRYPSSAGEPYLELYDLAADPGERADLAAERPQVRDAQLQRLDRWLALGTDGPLRLELDPRVEQQLRELGYIEPDAP